MTTSNVTHVGQINGAGSLTALERDLVQAETIDAYFKATVTDGKFEIKTVIGGNAATFYATGRAKVGSHIAGEELLGQQAYKKNQITVFADNVIVSHEFIDKNEWLRSAIDDKVAIARTQGQAIAEAFDKQQLRTVVLAARSAGLVTGEPGGSVIEVAGLPTDMDVFIEAVAAAREQLVMKGFTAAQIATMNLYVHPSIYTKLADTTKLVNRDWVKMDNGDYARGTVYKVKDFTVIETPNFPNGYNLTNDASVTAIGEDPTVVTAKYRGDFTNTWGVIAGRRAIASARVIAPTSEVTYLAEKLGWLMTAYMACGSGVYDAREAIELREDVTP